MAHTDVAIIGAGILGLATARELLKRRPGLTVTIVEREPAIAAHQTGHNSGVVHAGIYYAPGSLKARLCVEGARDLYELVERRGDIPYERCGKLIVATSDAELPALDELERRGHANSVPGLRRLNASELKEIEPHATGVAALHSPATGIIDFGAVARAIAGELEEQGVTIATGRSVTGLRPRQRELEIRGADLTAKFAVCCAGLWSDRLAVAAGADPDPRIVPFRGAYLKLKPEKRSLVNALIYPVPDPALPFLGVHLSKKTSGDVVIGPTALLALARDAYDIRKVRPRDAAATLAWPGSWRMFARFWRTGLTEMHHAASAAALAKAAQVYVPELQAGDIADGDFSGLRAQALGRDGKLVDDFVFSRTERALHVRNAPSPAATSALAIARLIADRAEPALG